MGRATSAFGVEPTVLLVIAVGGGLGALARYGIGVWWPPQPREVPWATFTINAVGCFAIGVVMVLISEVWVAHRLFRPFIVVGVFGGFTTFSTYSLEVRTLLQSGAVAQAFGYLGATVVASLVMVVLGTSVTRWLTGAVRTQREYP